MSWSGDNDEIKFWDSPLSQSVALLLFLNEVFLSSLSIKRLCYSSFLIKCQVHPLSQSSVVFVLSLNLVLRLTSFSFNCQDCPCSSATRLSSFLIKCQDCALPWSSVKIFLSLDQVLCLSSSIKYYVYPLSQLSIENVLFLNQVSRLSSLIKYQDCRLDPKVVM